MSEASQSTSKAKRRRAPRTLRFTREGRVFVLATVGLGAAAVNTGNNLMYLVLGLLLSLIVLSGLLSESVLRKIRVRRRLPRRAFADVPCLVELEVSNGKRWLPTFSIELEDLAEGEPTPPSVYLLKVPAGEMQLAAYTRVPSRRGPLVLSEVRVRTRFPFGLFEKARRLRVEDTILVYPALVPPPVHGANDGVSGPDVAFARPGAGSELADLRLYRAGDEARAIHWRRSAAVGEIVVRERHRDAARRLTLVVDEGRPDGAGPEWNARFERSLSEAAATARQALERGVTVDAVARTGSSPQVQAGSSPDPLWRFLALLEPTPAGEAPALPTPRHARPTSAGDER